MTISATDFQLSVNEYFTKATEGEEIIIERYGKRFAVLMSFTEYEKLLDKLNSIGANQDNKNARSETSNYQDSKNTSATASVGTGQVGEAVGSNENANRDGGKQADFQFEPDDSLVFTKSELIRLIKKLLKN